MSKLYAVVYETAYSSKTLMVGTRKECESFMSENSFYADFAFIQELEEEYA